MKPDYGGSMQAGMPVYAEPTGNNLTVKEIPSPAIPMPAARRNHGPPSAGR